MHFDRVEEYKIFLWKNVVNYFIGEHSDCLKHKPTRIWNGILIHGNKHTINAHFANKLICWKSIWTSQICASNLYVNGHE